LVFFTFLFLTHSKQVFLRLPTLSTYKRSLKVKKEKIRNKRNANPCSSILCPQGTQCDSNTGICRPFRPLPNYPAATDPCSGVVCPQGTQCDTNTVNVFSGICRPFRPLPNPPAASDPCERVSCPQGTACDTNTGICRPFRPLPDAPIGKCQGVICPQGTECDTNTGICRPFRPADSTTASCPANSYYSDCASPCPPTCTEAATRCSLACIPTCVCNNGYTQASATDTTCVLSTQCSVYQADRCTALQCPSDMTCIDGYCNPRHCPMVVKPPIRSGCRYMLTRNVNNCLTIDLSC
ncbi:trypsin Inhibitor like cysteine rich domain protein, partial [Ancylostoma caninum]